MIKEEEIRVIKLFKALSNPSRYKIIKQLAKEETTSGELCKLINKTDSATSQHLRILKNIDIIKYHMKKNTVVYSLKKTELYNFIVDFEKYYLRNETTLEI